MPKLRQKIGEAIVVLAETLCDREAPGSPGWPALLPMVFRLAAASQYPRVGSCESALELFKNLVPGARGQLGQVLQAGLTGAELGVKASAMLLVGAVVEVADQADWAPLLSTASVLTDVMQLIAASGMQDKLQGLLEAYDEMATASPDFFKAQLASPMEPANLLATWARARGSLEDGTRQLALEELVTFAESKPKWLTVSLPAYAPACARGCHGAPAQRGGW